MKLPELKINKLASQLADIMYDVRNNISMVSNGIWTQAIQNALDNYKKVYIPYSDTPYIIDNRLIIKSGTHLIIHPNAELYLADGANTCMIRNENILSVTPDNNIIIEGGIWNGNSTNQSDLYPGSDKVDPVVGVSGNISMMGVNNFTIRNITVKDAKGFAVQTSSCSYFLIEDIYLDNTGRDGIHISGSNTHFTVRNIKGIAVDDIVALNAWDWLKSTPAYGDISNGYIQNIDAVSSSGCLLKFLSATDSNSVLRSIYNISVKGIKGIGHYSCISFAYNSDTETPSNTSTAGIIWDIEIDDINFKTDNNSYHPIIFYSTEVKNVTINNIKLDSTNTTSFIDVDTQTTVDQLNISNVTSKNDYTNNFIVLNGASAQITNININNVQIKFTAGNWENSLIRCSGSIAPGIINIDNLIMSGGTAILRQDTATTGTTTININNYNLNATLYGILSSISVKINWSNGNSNTTYALNYASGSTANIRTTMTTTTICNIAITAETGSVSSINAPTQSTDISKLTPQPNDQVINNNSSLGCGVGLVLRNNDNTQWKNLFTGATL